MKLKQFCVICKKPLKKPYKCGVMTCEDKYCRDTLYRVVGRLKSFLWRSTHRPENNLYHRKYYHQVTKLIKRI